MDAMYPTEIPPTPRFTTTDAAVCRNYIRDNTKTHNFDMNGRTRLVNFEHHDCPVGRISVNWCDIACTAAFRITKVAPASYYSFNFIVKGNGEFEGAFGSAALRPGGVFVLAPEHVTREFWADQCQLFVVRVDRQLVEHVLSEELAKKICNPVGFDPVSNDPGIAPWLNQVARSLWAGGSNAALISHPRVMKSLERTLVNMLLSGLRHSETDDLIRHGQGAAPYYMRRAERFIHEQAREDMAIEEIAQRAGVSVRSLFYGFKRWCNTTPMAYVRNVRLDIARKELEKARSMGGTVSNAAIAAGFTNFSQFSKIYKARFGETPSATLRG